MKTLSYALPRLRTTQLALLGILMALEIVIGRFTFGPASVKVGFTFIVVGLIAKWYGPYWGMIVAFFNDFLSTMISGYSYFWGFAVSALVGAAIYGFAFYGREHISWLRVIVTVILVLFLVNAVLNTLWIVIMGGMTDPKAITSLLWVRGIKQFIFLPIQAIILYFFLNHPTLEQMRERLLFK